MTTPQDEATLQHQRAADHFARIRAERISDEDKRYGMTVVLDSYRFQLAQLAAQHQALTGEDGSELKGRFEPVVPRELAAVKS